mmetsp:Transcript_39658/g.71157  ORF Transcript_39658/g.71157 Transcript_39658/m.71157 type:complete len:81 (+) Transcript_39658:1143-1385(+)
MHYVAGAIKMLQRPVHGILRVLRMVHGKNDAASFCRIAIAFRRRGCDDPPQTAAVFSDMPPPEGTFSSLSSVSTWTNRQY